MSEPLSQAWNLETIFPGGSQSSEFKEYLDTLEEETEAFGDHVRKMNGSLGTEPKKWQQLTDNMQELMERLKQAGAFTSCLVAQDVKDQTARILSGRVKKIQATLSSALTLVDQAMLEISDQDWDALIDSDELWPIAFPLQERRQQAQDKLEPSKEALAGELAVDGYHGWSELYNTVVGRMSIPIDGKDLSVGQASNLLSDNNREVRTKAFAGLQQAWEQEAELCSSALNHLAGFRLYLYKNRGWNSVLQEPLHLNRMSEQTLQVMWDVINETKPHLEKYLQQKAALLGLAKLNWYDVGAPLGESDEKVSYQEAADFILEHFNAFNPEMADFANKAFQNRWIEAEDRPGKRPGGFCTSFPLNKESRIFMTFSGSASNVSTLAHELGHAYHQSVMNDLPPLAQRYRMNVAETASTFAEMIVSDAAIKTATSDKQRLTLLDDKIGRSVAFFMNIHARFLFETSFYQRRKQGLLRVDELNELMVSAQKEAYCEALGEYDPYFWASKLHFYITGVPFYNFPYTFGYLFSTGVYARATTEGQSFAKQYAELLGDTGSMTVEQLASKHLDVDLTLPDFWRMAVQPTISDIQEFMNLTTK